ncbi:hypothetical protein ACFC6L_30350 [Kitasatospora phosalacinea]|uniref:hypothetical protein n=1 Tax=Kitasatospora phosalacinea TaxID=2065 RepID=UPI0035E005E5
MLISIGQPSPHLSTKAAPTAASTSTPTTADDRQPDRFKIAADTAAVGPLDGRPDLLQTDPFAFKRVMRELFTAMGYET